MSKQNTEALIKHGTKANILKDKDKNKDKHKDLNLSSYNTNAPVKISGKLNGKLEKDDLIIQDEYKTNQETHIDSIKLEDHANNSKAEEYIPNGKPETLQEKEEKQNKKIKYFEMLKDTIIQERLLK